MKRSIPVLLVLGLFFLISYRGILFEPGHVYQNWDNGTPPFQSQLERYGSISRYSWNPLYELGSPGAFNGVNRYADLFVREFAAPLGGAVVAKWHGLVYALVGGLGLSFLCRALGLGAAATLLGCLLWCFNPRMYSLAVSGHLLEMGFALALLPWTLFTLVKANAETRRLGKTAWVVLSGMLGALACSGSAIGIVFFGVFLVFLAVSEGVSRRSCAPVLTAACAGAVVVLLSLHWLVPAASLSLKGGGGVKYNQSAESVRDNYRHMNEHFSVPPRNAMIGHTDDFGMGTEYAYPVSTNATPCWKASAYALLGLALFGLYFRRAGRSSRSLKYFAILCLAGGFVFFAGQKTLAGAYFYDILLSRVQMVYFYMARPARWLPVYFMGLSLLAGMGVQAVLDRRIWVGNRKVDVLAYAGVFLLLAVYLRPYWSGSITEPKTTTTQTMALTPQPFSASEEALARRLTNDPEDYRITVWPTIAGPTGPIPDPPKNALTRNFGMMGKDAVIGPTFVGETYCGFMLNLLYRPYPFTDRFGRLLGLAAARRVLFDPSEPYLSYSGFGWAPTTKRGPETLFDPGGILERFVHAQKDLSLEKDWKFPPFEIYANRDWLPRLRTASQALLSAGGAPFLQTLAELPDNLFADAALFMSADADRDGLDRLSGTLRGVAVPSGAKPELLLPFLPKGAFVPALESGKRPPEGFSSLVSRRLRYPAFDATPLAGAGLVSDAAGEARLSPPGPGTWRVHLLYGRGPGGGTVAVSLAGKILLRDAGPAVLRRGLVWRDLGDVSVEGDEGLVVSVDGPGAVVCGMAAATPDDWAKAEKALAAKLGSGRILVAAEAEAAAREGAAAYAPRVAVDLLGARTRTAMAGSVRVERAAPAGSGLVAAEGGEGEILFTVPLGRKMRGFVLTSYPRLFGDKEKEAFVEASYSLDGRDFTPLYKVRGKKDGRWEDVYKRRMVSDLAGESDTVWIRFRMRQAQLSSQANRPNIPMRLAAEPVDVFPAAVSMGQAVPLPAAFVLEAPFSGAYRAGARVLGRTGDVVRLSGGAGRRLNRDGASWVDLGELKTDARGRLDLRLEGSWDAVCDIIVLEREKGAASGGAVPYVRDNPGRYRVELGGTSGLLLFSEAYNPGWLLDRGNGPEKPMRAYGFMNAWPLDAPGSDGAGGAEKEDAEVYFREQPVMEKATAVTRAVWVALAALLAVSGVGALVSGPGRKNGKEG